MAVPVNQNKQERSRTDALRALSRGACIAALYAAMTLVLAPISYGPIQLRVSEALTLLPWHRREAVPALTLGCVAANFIGGYGIIDAIVGGGATLIAALLTHWLSHFAGAKSNWLAAVPPVIINMLMVGTMLHILTEAPLVATCLYVGLGEVAACFGVGLPLMKILERRGIL